MKTGWKTFWIVLIILILLGIWWAWTQYVKWKGIWDKITFGKPIPTNLDLKGLTLLDFLNPNVNNQDKNVDATLKMGIRNDSDTDVSFNDLKIKLFYNGQLITETSDELSKKDFVLKANDTLPIEDTIKINLKTASQFLIEKAKGNHPTVEYTVDLSVNGIPITKIYPIKSTFTW